MIKLIVNYCVILATIFVLIACVEKTDLPTDMASHAVEMGADQEPQKETLTAPAVELTLQTINPGENDNHPEPEVGQIDKEIEPDLNFAETAARLFTELPPGKVIAFVQFTDTQGEETPFSRAVLQQLEPIIVAEGMKKSISFIERKDLKLILDEWDLNSVYQTEGGDSGAQTLLGADYILTGNVGQAGKFAQCSLKLVALKNGRIISTVVGKMPTEFDYEATPHQKTLPTPNPEVVSGRNRAESTDKKLAIWTSKDSYEIGDSIEIFFTVNEPLYVEILDVTPEGEITRIFPNHSQTDNYCHPGKLYRIPPENGDFELIVSPPAGVDRLKVLAGPNLTDNSHLIKTRGIQFTKKLVTSSSTRANLAFTIR